MAEELVGLEPGTRVSGGRWTITKKLGAGAFGAVYLCQDDKGTQAALKTEPVVTPHPLLVMEAHVMRSLDNLRDGDGKHFCRCLDLGRDEQRDSATGTMKSFNYIVMSLVGRGLDGVVRDAGGRFSPGTAIGVSIQMLSSLRAMHSIGYLHRDIKPGNSTIGRPEANELRLLYMIDFGMARKFLRDDGSHRRPRTNANFRGSPRYASISAHINREYCRKDDIESWFYVMIELYKGALPWANISDMKAIGDMKCLRLKKQPENDELKFSDQPDYDLIISILRKCLSSNGFQEHPYDWEVGKRNTGQEQAPRGGGGGGGDSFFN
uniref:Protein kinase domain-containing protein n=1 Tax=Globodera pallida TaxID=36090 RepID=A0A183BI07_GLOPA